MTNTVIELRALSKRYGGDRGLQATTLEIRRGEIFGFLGPNGAGKTTTIRTLLGFLRPTSGEARVLGLDVATRSVDIRRRVGYLPGELVFEPRRTPRDLFAFYARLRGVQNVAYALDLSRRLDLDVSRPIGALSKGNKQKVGLVSAFMSRPELLILDEPTDGLDPLMQEEVHALIQEARAEGRTVFLSSHVLSEVDRVADRVGIIRAGELVMVSSVADVKARLPHRLEIRFAVPVPQAVFASIEGLRDVRVLGNVVSCVLAGGADALLKAASAYPVLDIRGSEPNLEEAFLSFYQAPSGERGVNHVA
ncbi:ABC transporter ATP-binding protein [Deinococcus yavapaiensis]|uniref:ABC-2 type transport system ATP-binding protein n=1 Tax=Deinococcus yavapaiensis KR-236 TaxID=694435 RepID=A0A318SBI7_9DEIO|nr:ABC transporter ATP-binding protein [Deinococcus yavapaiensis]PYE55942.1 ABC-2 type transport system ATP-binding protein [Deinococcus yavapaiensis KR-236]